MRLNKDVSLYKMKSIDESLIKTKKRKRVRKSKGFINNGLVVRRRRKKTQEDVTEKTESLYVSSQLRDNINADVTGEDNRTL